MFYVPVNGVRYLRPLFTFFSDAFLLLFLMLLSSSVFWFFPSSAFCFRSNWIRRIGNLYMGSEWMGRECVCVFGKGIMNIMTPSNVHCVYTIYWSRRVCQALRKTINRKMVFIYSTKCETSRSETIAPFSIADRWKCCWDVADGRTTGFMWCKRTMCAWAWAIQ